MFFMTIFPGSDIIVGTQLYTTPGTHNFTVPDFNTMTVELWGGGGSGGGVTVGTGNFAGQNGQNSYFYGVTTVPVSGGFGAPAANGSGGAGGLVTGGDELLTESGEILYDEEGNPFYVGVNEGGSAGGANGVGTGGAAGGIPYGGGGTRLPPGSDNSNGAAGFSYGGGGAGGRAPGNQRPGGGGAAYVRKDYTFSEGDAPTPGDIIQVYVGLGGAPGTGAIKGGAGANGAVRITWQ